MSKQTIGQRLHDLRKMRGVTLAELGKRVGLSQPQLSRLESGKQGFRSATLLRLAKVLDVKPLYFFLEQEGESAEDPPCGLLTGGNLMRALQLVPPCLTTSQDASNVYPHLVFWRFARAKMSQRISSWVLSVASIVASMASRCPAHARAACNLLQWRTEARKETGDTVGPADAVRLDAPPWRGSIPH